MDEMENIICIYSKKGLLVMRGRESWDGSCQRFSIKKISTKRHENFVQVVEIQKVS